MSASSFSGGRSPGGRDNLVRGAPPAIGQCPAGLLEFRWEQSAPRRCQGSRAFIRLERRERPVLHGHGAEGGARGRSCGGAGGGHVLRQLSPVSKASAG